MTRAASPFIRASDVPRQYPISRSTLLRWAKAGRLTIHHPSPAIAVVRRSDLEAALVGLSVGLEGEGNASA